MPTPIQGIPPTGQQWARGVEADLKNVKRKLGIVGDALAGVPELDKTVYAEFSNGQNISSGVSGKVAPSQPVKVRFVSSTGLFEVTVSLAGLVRDGAIFGAGFESQEIPSVIEYDIPKDGVVSSAPIGQTSWTPFAASYSTVITARPGVQDLSLYLYAVCTAGEYSAAYLKRTRLSVKAV
jgi:hypothetical protein